MSDRRPTDAQIASALRAYLPIGAQPGLSGRVMDAVDATSQQPPLPSVLSALSDVDLIGRRRALLIAAAMLAVLALASAAAIGASHLLQRDPMPLDLAPPADVQALVLSTYDRMTEMPPVTISTIEDQTTAGRILVAPSGAVRIEHFASTDASEPATYEIFDGTTRGAVVAIAGERFWLRQDDAISEDPRVFLLAQLQGGGVGAGPDCGVTRDEDAAGNGTAAAGWTYVGAEAVIERPTYHVRCAQGDLWIDVETSLILRSRGPIRDADSNLIPGSSRTIEVTALEFGDPPEAAFDLEPPPGVTRLSVEDYQCRLDPTLCPAPPTPTPIASAQAGSDRLPPLVGTGARNGWLAFSSDGQRPGTTDDATGSDIYIVRGGGEPRLIADRVGGTTRNVCPAFAPDGEKLAYGVGTDSSRAIVIRTMDADGVRDDPIRLDVLGPGDAPCPRWSSDGTRLAYVEGGAVVVRGLDGSVLTAGRGDPSVEAFAGVDPGDPLASPTGDRLVRTDMTDGTCRLVIATPDGSAAESASLAFCPYAIPTWSPDGRQVVLMTDISGHDFSIELLTAERPFSIVTLVPSIRTNGARSWPGTGDVSWQGLP